MIQSDRVPLREKPVTSNQPLVHIGEQHPRIDQLHRVHVDVRELGHVLRALQFTHDLKEEFRSFRVVIGEKFRIVITRGPIHHYDSPG